MTKESTENSCGNFWLQRCEMRQKEKRSALL
jgi:hypothetical protein